MRNGKRLGYLARAVNALAAALAADVPVQRLTQVEELSTALYLVRPLLASRKHTAPAHMMPLARQRFEIAHKSTKSLIRFSTRLVAARQRVSGASTRSRIW